MPRSVLGSRSRRARVESIGTLGPRALLPRDVGERADRAHVGRHRVDDRAVVALGRLAVLEHVARQLGDGAVELELLALILLDEEIGRAHV